CTTGAEPLFGAADAADGATSPARTSEPAAARMPDRFSVRFMWHHLRHEYRRWGSPAAARGGVSGAERKVASSAEPVLLRTVSGDANTMVTHRDPAVTPRSCRSGVRGCRERPRPSARGSTC